MIYYSDSLWRSSYGGYFGDAFSRLKTALEKFFPNKSWNYEQVIVLNTHQQSDGFNCGVIILSVILAFYNGNTQIPILQRNNIKQELIQNKIRVPVNSNLNQSEWIKNFTSTRTISEWFQHFEEEKKERERGKNKV